MQLLGVMDKANKTPVERVLEEFQHLTCLGKHPCCVGLDNQQDN